MQKHTHTTLLLLLNKKNEHEVLVICPRSKKKINCLKKTQGNSRKINVTQGSSWSFRGDFLIQRVATLFLVITCGYASIFVLGI